MSARPVRRLPLGGFLCEYGNNYGHTPCNRRAVSIMRGYDPTRPAPGTIVCARHRRFWPGLLWDPLQPEPDADDLEQGAGI